MNALRLLTILNVLLIACSTPTKTMAPTLSESQQLESKCEQNLGAACFELGTYFLSHDVVSNRRAKRAFESGCALEFGKACLALGNLMKNDESPPFVPAIEKANQATIFYDQACRFGTHEGCRKLGRHLFFTADQPRAQKRALQYFDELCDDGDVTGCVDGIRARLALGDSPSALLVSRLSVQCRLTGKNAGVSDTFCARLDAHLCQEVESKASCFKALTEQSIVDEPTCPSEDTSWLLSSIHTSVQLCKQRKPSQIKLKFDESGRFSNSSMEALNGSCLANRLNVMAILPPTSSGGCTLKVRF